MLCPPGTGLVTLELIEGMCLQKGHEAVKKFNNSLNYTQKLDILTQTELLYYVSYLIDTDSHGDKRDIFRPDNKNLMKVILDEVRPEHRLSMLRMKSGDR